MCGKKEKISGRRYLLFGSHGNSFPTFSGLRSSEVVALKWKDYSEESHILHIYESVTIKALYDENYEVKKRVREENESIKNCNTRNIILSKEAVEILEKVKAETKNYRKDGYIFVNEDGGPYTTGVLEGRARNIYKRAEMERLKSSLHVLRRTFVTTAHRSGWDKEEIAAYIGDDVDTLSKYYHSKHDLTETDAGMIETVHVNNLNIDWEKGEV